MTRFDLTDTTKQMIETALELDLIDVLTVVEVGSDSETDEEVQRRLIDCAYAFRHVDAEPHRALVRIRDEAAKAAA
jgi:hypothetical protein